MSKLTTIALVCALHVALVACHFRLRKVVKLDGRPVTALFEGFSYVGQVHDSVFRESHQLPDSLVSGDQYAFKLQLESSDQELPPHFLVDRLQRMGFDVTEGPTADGHGYFVMDPGGTAFRIQARASGCSISITKSDMTYFPQTRTFRWESFYWESGVYELVLGEGCRSVLY